MRLQAGIRLAVLVLVFASVVGLARSDESVYGFSYDGTMTIDCDGFVANDGSAWLDRDNTGDNQEHFILVAWDGAGNILWYQDDTYYLVEKVNGIGVVTWTTPPECNPITFQAISAAGNNLPEEIGFEATGICEGLPTCGKAVVMPGCDMQMDIPTAAAGGAFVTDAPIYYTPGQLVEPETTIAAGNTAWVLGVDASGAYYKIVWGCQYLWVPVSTMGPNYDDVWNGAPLPTGVVE